MRRVEGGRQESAAAQPAAEPLSRIQTLRGMRLWNVSGGLFAVFVAVTLGAPVTGFALRLGASEAMIGFLGAAPTLSQLVQVVAPLLTERQRRRKPFCVGAFLAGYSMWLLVALIPWMGLGSAQAWTMIGLVFLGSCLTAMASPATNSWLTDLVPQDIRGRFIARQQSITGFVGLVAGVAAGKYLDQFPEAHTDLGFMSLFVIAVLFSMASIVAWLFVPEPEPSHRSEGFDLRVLLLPARDLNFRNLTMFVAIRTSAVYIAAPFFAVFMLKELKIPYTQIAIYFSAATLTSVFTYPLWGYLADKFGYKPLLRISSFGIALNPLPWFFTNPGNCRWLIPLSQVWGGFFAAGLVLSQFNLMLKIAPAKNRSVYIGYYNAVASVFASLGSIGGGLLAKFAEPLGPWEFLGHHRSHLQVVFMVSALVRMLGLGFLQRVRETDEVSARTVMRQVRSGNPLLTLWNLLRMIRSTDPATKVKATKGLGSSGSELAVDELTAALTDSDRDVRREAARALGSIGQEKAVWPLMEAVLNPATDLVEDAVDALGKIASPRSLPALLELLADPRPTVRKAVALALGNLDSREAVDALEEMLEAERDPAVFLAVTEALARNGGKRAVHRLRQLLRKTQEPAARRQVANSIGNLLGPNDTFYKLLEADTMVQEEMVVAMVKRCRRLLVRGRVVVDADREAFQTALDDALRCFEQREYSSLVHFLRRAVSRATRALVEQRADLGPPHARIERRVGALLAANPLLQLSFGYLSGLVRDSRGQLNREEGLLAVFALQQVTDELVRLGSGREARRFKWR